MGGNALKHVGVKRISTEDLLIVQNEITNLFSEYLEIEFVPFVREKFDHGDIDVLVCSKSKDTISNILKRVYNPEYAVFNGGIISFAYKFKGNLYQVDFITSNNMKKDKFYFSYGILGMVIGRMATRCELSFDGGLKLIITGKNVKYVTNEIDIHDDQKIGKISLTNDPENVCEFLGMSYDRWLQGFDINTDLYDWLLTCNLFKKSMFTKLNNDRGQIFVAYVQNFNDKEPYDVFEAIISRYSIMDKIIEIVEKAKRKENIKSKYDTHLIMQRGIQGKEIGSCDNYLKSRFDDFDEWIYQNDKETVLIKVNGLIDDFLKENKHLGYSNRVQIQL